MSTLTVALTSDNNSQPGQILDWLDREPIVNNIVIFNRTSVAGKQYESVTNKCRLVEGDLTSGAAIKQFFDELQTDFLLLLMPGQQIRPGPRMIERFLSEAVDTGAGLVYSDFKDEVTGQAQDHPLIDYQPGSIRDTFDFGAAFMISKRAASSAVIAHGQVDSSLRWGGLYDLRLKLSIDHRLLRVPEPLYTRVPSDLRATGEKQFDYVDPRLRDYQREMEQVATEHLKRIGAYVEPQSRQLPPDEKGFKVRASVVIPVRNRERTIRDAIFSALSQKAPFDYNVIVVDNHSTDRTTVILSDLAREDRRLIHIIPERTDLGIGGCWNEAVYSDYCGKYAVQLDSDDLYSDERTLERIVAKFEEKPYGMVIGSYTIVNFDLQEIPPGLIDHREWTRENGPNNALRINGLGAPRAFYVPLIRKWGLPNVSYGEDYSAALRVSREYEIGRIYDSIYYARRWEGNSDAALSVGTANRYDAYKDHIRSVEILARKRMNQK